jgi:hypothetical protein
MPSVTKIHLDYCGDEIYVNGYIMLFETWMRVSCTIQFNVIQHDCHKKKTVQFVLYIMLLSDTVHVTSYTFIPQAVGDIRYKEHDI